VVAPAVPPTIVADPDGVCAANRAIALTARTGERTAVWVGGSDEPALDEFRAELSRV